VDRKLKNGLFRSIPPEMWVGEGKCGKLGIVGGEQVRSLLQAQMQIAELIHQRLVRFVDVDVNPRLVIVPSVIDSELDLVGQKEADQLLRVRLGGK
jgi:hypothetical protein